MSGPSESREAHSAEAVRAPGQALSVSTPPRALTPGHRQSRHHSGERLTFERVSREKPIPLALAQERFWYLHQLDPASPADNVAVALRIHGPLREELFRRAWSTILLRHEVLRTRFPAVGGQPVQVIEPSHAADVRVVDLRHVAAEQRGAAAIEAATLEADKPFDLTTGPVYRLTLFRLGDQEHLAVVALHHIVCDLWSLGVLSAELSELYSAAADDRPPRLPEPPFQYADYAVCHCHWVEGDILQNDLDYWREQLADLRVSELPSDRPRARRPGEGATVFADLPLELLADVRSLAVRQGVTPAMVLISAFLVLLSRYTGQQEVVVGVPTANRSRLELKTLVGTFVNTLVLRQDLSGVSNFRELLSRTRSMALDAFAHQELPFHRLVRELGPERSLGRSTFFQTLFNVQNAPVREPQIPGLTVVAELLPRRAAQFDLAVSVDIKVLHQVVATYDTSLFDALTIERLLGHYLHLLRELIRAPEAPLAGIDILPGAERALILQEWNRTAEVVSPESVIDLFERQVARTPDATALVAGGMEFSYAELDCRSRALARLLDSGGIGPGSLVALCCERSAQLLVALLGILKTGAAYLPLDPGFPRERLVFQMKDAGAEALLVDNAGAELLSDCAPWIVKLDQELPVAQGHEPFVRRVVPDSLAYVLYTSGSTGIPKGVEISHRSLANFIHAMRRCPGIGPADRVLAATTISFDIAGLEIFLPLVVGATVVLATREDAVDPSRLARLIEEERVSLFQATPATWRMLLESAWQGKSDLAILCGGESLSRELGEQLLARGRSVWNLYGPTETTIWSTLERVESGSGPVSIGRPIANTQVYVLDKERRPVPIGVPGDLYIAGEGLARGYRGRRELTSECFVQDPFGHTAGARMYRTGDIARFLPDGRLECLGRVDNQVKIRGFRVELGEVEARLTTAPGVRHGVVVAQKDTSGESRLVAFVVSDSSQGSSADTLRAYLAERLPQYMVPSYFALVPALPHTPNGKVDRARLSTMAIHATSAQAEPASLTDTQRRMIAIWADILSVSPIGIDDDFFQLGGHSLLAVRLMSKLNAEFGRNVSLATLLEARSIRRMAEIVDGDWPDPQSNVLVVLQSKGRRPPFFCVHGVGGEVLIYVSLAERLAPDQPFVAIQAPSDEERARSLDDLQAQAKLYVEEMRRYQPQGPYYIGGYSSGGRIALEMCIQLEAAGQEVAFLGILDTTPYNACYRSFQYLLRVLRNFPRWLYYDALRTPWRGNVDRVRRKLRNLSRRLAAVARGAPGRAEPDIRSMMDIEGLPPPYQRRYERDYRAFMRYRPGGTCGQVTLFRARGQPVLGSHEPDLGWGAVTRCPVRVESVPGNHASILAEPCVGRLAEALEAALGDAWRERNL